MIETFTIEVDKTLNPVYGSLNESCLKQFINTFIIKDSNLSLFQNYKDEIENIILNYRELSDDIHFLIGDTHVDDIIKIIDDNLSSELKTKLFELLEIPENPVELDINDELKYPVEIQVAAGFGNLIGIIITTVIGGAVYLLLGKKKISGRKPFGDNIETVHALIKNPKLSILIINYGDRFQKKILKVNINPHYFQMYLDELTIYNKLRAQSRANVAEFTEASIAASTCDRHGNGTVSLSIEGRNHLFNLLDICHQIPLLDICSKATIPTIPIELVYLSGNYYEDTIDFYNLLINHGLNITNIKLAVFDILRNISLAYNDIGFIHGDMKIDNVLIQTQAQFKRFTKSIIFDLDFSYVFEKKLITNIDNLVVNGYLEVPEYDSSNKQNNLTREFLHFFDIYLFNMSLQTYLNVAQLNDILIEIGNMCQNQYSTIENSFKYFYLIYKLTEHYDLSNKQKYKIEMFHYFNIVSNFNKFKKSTKIKSLAPFEKLIFDEVLAIFNNQELYINP